MTTAAEPKKAPSLLDELKKLPTCAYSRSEDDVRRTGGSRVVHLYMDAARDLVIQVDTANSKSRSAKGVPASGNVPSQPYGEWQAVTL